MCVVRVECARSSDASVLFKLYLCGIMELGTEQKGQVSWSSILTINTAFRESKRASNYRCKYSVILKRSSSNIQ